METDIFHPRTRQLIDSLGGESNLSPDQHKLVDGFDANAIKFDATKQLPLTGERARLVLTLTAQMEEVKVALLPENQ
jgi:hypothetical protein